MSWDDPKVWTTGEVIEKADEDLAGQRCGRCGRLEGYCACGPLEAWMAAAHATRSMRRLEFVIVSAIVFLAGVFVVWAVSTVVTLIGGAL